MEKPSRKPAAARPARCIAAGSTLKSAITGGDEHAILAECERGEDSAVEEYKKALDDGLTPSAQELVSRQFAEIKAAHDRIKSLRDAAKG